MMNNSIKKIFILLVYFISFFRKKKQNCPIYMVLRKNKMLQLLPQSEIFIPTSKSPVKTAECINSYINSTNCEKLSVDISFMNLMDACYVSTMCSTNHYIKYPDGQICWYVSSKMTKEIASSLSLGNAEFQTLN